MTRRRTYLLAVLLLLLAVWASNRIRLVEPQPSDASLHPLGAQAVSLSRHPGRIADEAGALGYFQKKLERMSDQWMEDLGVDFQVATLLVPSTPIADLAGEVFQLRRIGAEAPTGGILVLLNPVRAEARIEISYELEGIFPDALVGRIAQDQLVPYVSYGTSGMAVMDVMHVLEDRAYVRAISGELSLSDDLKSQPSFQARARFLSGGAGAQVEIPDAPADADFKARVPDEKRPRYAPSSEPRESVEAYLRVLRERAGDPSLDLFTPGSRLMRERYPFALFEEAERLHRLESSRPLRIVAQGDRAVATSDRPAPGFVPVPLHRIDGTWRVDRVETWKNLFFTSRGDYTLVNSNNPYAFGLAAFGRGRHHDVAAWDLGGADLATTVATLEAGHDPLFEFLLGDLLFRNAFLALEALQHYEEAVRLAPEAPLFRVTLADRALYLGFAEMAAAHYAKVGAPRYPELADAYARTGDLAAAVETMRRAVERNPYDREALSQLLGYLRRQDAQDEAEAIESQLAELERDPKRKHDPVSFQFRPSRPELHIDQPTVVGTTTVYDHSFFSTTITNHSVRPVVLLSILLTSAGTGSTSGLGDIRGYWKWPSGANTLAPGESLPLDRTWGFTADTAHVQLSYVFDYCWQGVGEDIRQCSAARVDTFPR